MATRTLSTIRTQIRRILRDETEASYVWTETELNTYINTAVYAFGRRVPKESSASLSLTASEDDYTIPTGATEIVSIKVGDDVYTVIEVFGGSMKLSPTPAAAATATVKYRGWYTQFVVATDASTSDYDLQYEELIDHYVLYLALSAVAGDGARYYQYTEGDISEDQGKTQKYFRDEANAHLLAFEQGCLQAIEERAGLQSAAVADAVIATKITRLKPERQTTYERLFR